MLNRGLEVVYTREKGRCIYTSQDLDKDQVIEISPVIVMDKKDRALIEQTLLTNYIFEWGPKLDKCAVGLGYVSLYNHASKANCAYSMVYSKKIMYITTVRKIKAGEELTINYHGVYNDKRPVWFDAV